MQHAQDVDIGADAVITRLGGLLPEIRQRRAEIEQARRLPPDVAEKLLATGLYRLSVPTDLGGCQASPLDLMRAIETVAAADGSAGWCAMVGIGNNAVAGYMADAGAREVFADPAMPTAGIAAPAGGAVRADGGLRVSGRWPFASGITHCDWVWAGALVMEHGRAAHYPAGTGDRPPLHSCRRASQIHDTWHVSGLCGTGSQDFSAEDVFVPESPRVRPARSRPVTGRSRSIRCRRSGSSCTSSPASASASPAPRSTSCRRPALSKMPTLYHGADGTVGPPRRSRSPAPRPRSAQLVPGLYAAVADVWETIPAGRRPSARQLALGRAASTHAVETAAAIARTANTLGGGSSIYSASSPAAARPRRRGDHPPLHRRALHLGTGWTAAARPRSGRSGF